MADTRLDLEFGFPLQESCLFVIGMNNQKICSIYHPIPW